MLRRIADREYDEAAEYFPVDHLTEEPDRDTIVGTDEFYAETYGVADGELAAVDCACEQSLDDETVAFLIDGDWYAGLADSEVVTEC